MNGEQVRCVEQNQVAELVQRLGPGDKTGATGKMISEK